MTLTRLTGRLICANEAERRLVLAELPLHIRATVREPGCLSFNIAQSADPMIWQVDEIFASKAAFAAHQTRTASSRWGAATRALRRDYSLSEISPEIAPETPEDARAIYLLTRAAFGAPEEAELIDALRAAGDLALSLTARAGRAFLGHVAFSPMTAPIRAWALAPVSVRAAARGQGIAAALIRAGIAIARARGIEALFVLGDPAYYGRFGFAPAPARAYPSPYAGPHFQILNLRARALATGPVAHAPAFAALN